MKEREKTTLSGNGLSRGRVRRKHFAKRGMAYFLTFLMLMGSVQTVTYAEENAKEIAGHLDLGEEKPSLEETEALVKTEERTDRPEEAVTSETTVSSDTTGESEEGSSLKETGGKDKTELSSSEDGNEAIGSEDKKEDSSEQKSEEELSEEEKAKLSEEGKKEEEKAEYLKASSFSAQAESGLTVIASFPDNTFFEGTYMKVEPVEEEEKIEEAKKALEKEFQKEDPDAESEIEVLESVDISFYREINGEVKEVQPKKGKKVEISLQKTEKIKEALGGTEAEQEASAEEELKIVHLSEEHPTEILPVKEEGEKLLFSAKHFSPFMIGRRGKRDLSQAGHELKAFWKEAPDPNAGTNRANSGHSYTDGSNGEMRKQTELSIIPPENNSNAVNTTTLGVELTLKGDKNTVYKKETVNLYIPARIFKGWEDGHSDNANKDDYWKKNKITVSADRVNWVYRELPGIIHGLPEYPATNAQSSFNYKVEKKTVDGKTEPYLHLTNYNDLSGGVLFKADIGYNMTPSMLRVEDRVVNGAPKGVYEYKFPVSLEITENGNTVDSKSQDMSVHVETEVKETKVTLKPGTADVNGGVFFNWDPEWGDLNHWNTAWGTKPTGNPKDYFYAVWYVRVDRARGSSQPFKYQFVLDQTGLTEQEKAGGELVGAKKMPMDYRRDYYIYNEDGGNNIEVYAQGGYKNIAKYMDTNPDPNGADRYLVNPMGKYQEGISRDPSLYKLPDNEPYLTGHNYSPSGKYNSQLYALLFRYPYSKMKEVTDLYDKGMKISNQIKVTESWADGHTREFTVRPKEDMVIYPRPGGGGKFSFNKYGVDLRQNYLDIFGLQTIYKDGTPAPLRYGNRTKSFTLSAEYNAKNENVRIDPGSANYSTTANDPTTSMGSGVTLTDGKYYLLSSKIRYPSTLNGKYVNSNPANPDLEGLVNNTNTTDDVYRGNKYTLKDKDYYYSSIYLEGMKVYDVEKVDTTASQGLVSFNQKSTLRERKDNYPPVEIWLRKQGAGEGDFFKYGELYYDNTGVLRFRPVAGYENWTGTIDSTQTRPIDANNQLSLVNEKFGAPIVGLKLIQNSPYYRTGFDASYTMQITPTPEMQNAISETMARTDDYNISFLAGAATAEGWQYRDPNPTKLRIGQYWPQVGYALTPLQINSVMYKSSANFVDHPEKSAQSMTVYLEGANTGNLPTSLQGPEYTKKYMLKKGTIYDLLPAGTSVEEDSIRVSGWLGGWDLDNASEKLTKDENYTVRFEDNWKGSKQTMMIIDFTIPDVKQSWSSYHNRSGWKVMYTLWNPYTNIVDRGRSVKNTLGFINKDKDTVWNGNYISEERGKNPGVEKLTYYKDIKEKAAEENPRFTTSVIDRIMPFGPVTVLEAAFTNGVSTAIDPNFLSDNVSYMGDPYSHRLLYQAQATTRTTDIVLFDVLGDTEERNGDFNGVDISSMLTKPSYDKTNSSNTDTLLPKVYYATVVPSKEEMDVSNPIWHVWNYENESTNTVDRKLIKALAFDLRKTTAGKNFILDQQGLLLAKINMVASTDKSKVDPEVKVNNNKAYMYSTQFKGADVPLSSIPDVQTSTSSHRLVKPLIFDLPVRKDYDFKEGSSPPSIKEWFTFVLERADGEPVLNEDGTTVAEMKNPDDHGGLMVFEKLRLLKPGTYTFKIKEKGKNKAAGAGVKSEDMGDKFVTITVTDPDHKKLVSDLKYTKDKPLTFKNIYVVSALDMELKVDKILTAAPGLKKPDISNAFSFTLERVRKDDSPLPPMPIGAGTKDSMTLTNPDKDGGEINFGSITIENQGVYEYIIKESGFFHGVVNDPQSERRIKISVKDVGLGKLFALVTGDEPEFTNTFEPISNEERIELEKKVSGASPATPALFRFTLRPEETGGQPMPIGSSADSSTIELAGEGHTDFAPITFTKPGVFHYTVEEVNDGIAGYTYDPSVYTLSFTVTQSEDDIYNLIVDRKIYKDGVEVENIVFHNQYKSNSGGGGGGNPPKPIPVGPVTPGGPGEKPQEPEKPTVPDVPEEPTPTPGENVPPAPTIPERIREIEKRIGEILGEGRKRPLTEAEKKELKRLGEVLGALRKEQSRKVRTADASHMIWYAFASAISCLCLALYYLVDRKKRRR